MWYLQRIIQGHCEPTHSQSLQHTKAKSLAIWYIYIECNPQLLRISRSLSVLDILKPIYWNKWEHIHNVHTQTRIYCRCFAHQTHECDGDPFSMADWLLVRIGRKPEDWYQTQEQGLDIALKANGYLDRRVFLLVFLTFKLKYYWFNLRY